MSEEWAGEERRAVAIDAALMMRDMWSKILTGIVLAGILGSISLAFAQGTTNAEVKTTIKGIEELGLRRDAQLERLDIKIEDVKEDVGHIRDQQIKMDGKLDLLLERNGH